MRCMYALAYAPYEQPPLERRRHAVAEKHAVETKHWPEVFMQLPQRPVRRRRGHACSARQTIATTGSTCAAPCRPRTKASTGLMPATSCRLSAAARRGACTSLCSSTSSSLLRLRSSVLARHVSLPLATPARHLLTKRQLGLQRSDASERPSRPWLLSCERPAFDRSPLS